MIRWLISYLITFFKGIWQFIKRFFTSWKGIVSFIISFSLYVGWAIAFVVIGIIFGNAWLYSTGTTVILFWTGPFTPMWLLIVSTALVLQRYVFRDKKSMGWKEIKAYWKDEIKKEKDKAVMAKEKRKIKRELRAKIKQEKKLKKLIAKYNKQKGKEYIVYGLE
jgi:type VI protein secretion system component VasK